MPTYELIALDFLYGWLEQHNLTGETLLNYTSATDLPLSLSISLWSVRCKLYQYGFGFVWMNQGVEEINQFLHVFRERLIVCRWQEWHSHVETSDRFNVYRTFCTIHDTKTYLKMNVDRHLKFKLTSISDIAVHHCRYKRHTDKDLICPLCRVAQETELHFVLCCSVLRTLRAQFIPLKFYKFSSFSIKPAAGIHQRKYCEKSVSVFVQSL